MVRVVRAPIGLGDYDYAEPNYGPITVPETKTKRAKAEEREPHHTTPTKQKVKKVVNASNFGRTI